MEDGGGGGAGTRKWARMNFWMDDSRRMVPHDDDWRSELWLSTQYSSGLMAECA